MGGLDLSAVARGMKPTGVLSLREDARVGFGAGAIMVIDYGRPLVRERSVWGGVLVPFDSVWRYGANDATHLFTTRPLTFGTVSLTPAVQPESANRALLALPTLSQPQNAIQSLAITCGYRTVEVRTAARRLT